MAGPRADHETASTLDSLEGRFVVLGVTGGIAAYKAVEVCRRLVDLGAHVAPVLTEEATRFVGPLTFSALASEPCRTQILGSDEVIPHTRLGQRAEVVVVAPATARFIAAYATGLSDWLLTATVVATRAPVVVCPAMHTEMWEHPSVQENIATLRRQGCPDRLADRRAPRRRRLGPGPAGRARGHRRGGHERSGRQHAESRAAVRDLEGLRVLVTAGGTREPIDPVRFISNRSSGKQGHALAEAAARRGAIVSLVTAAPALLRPGVDEIVRVDTAAEMEEAVLARTAASDVVIMAAAVADFRPKVAADQKLSKRPVCLTWCSSRRSTSSPRWAADAGRARSSSASPPRPKKLWSAASQQARRAKVWTSMVSNDVTGPGGGVRARHQHASRSSSPEGAPPEVVAGAKSTVAHAVLDTVKPDPCRAPRQGSAIFRAPEPRRHE